MARNDEGEFELILGNRQLLLVFGVLVLVLGVFFTMGYLVGRNNPSHEAMTLAQSKRVPIEAGTGPSSARNPIVVDPSTSGSALKDSPVKERTEIAMAKPPEEKPKLPDVPQVPPSTPAKLPTAGIGLEDKPMRWLDAQTQEKQGLNTGGKKEAAVKETPKPKETPTPKETPAKPATTDAANPASGTYLQVVSVDKAGAQSMVSSLRNKSFQVVLAPGANPELYRVLVGPLAGKEALAKTKIDLEKVGIKGAFVKKY